MATVPTVVLRVGRDHARRLERWFGDAAERYGRGVQVVGQQDKGDLMLLRLEDASASGVTQFIQQFCTDDVVSVLPTLTRIFPTLHHVTSNNIEALAAQVLRDCATDPSEEKHSEGAEHCTNRSACMFRLQGCPRSLEQEVGPVLAAKGLRFAPRFSDCTHVISVVRLDTGAHPRDATETAAPRGNHNTESRKERQAGDQELPLLYSCLPKRAFQPFFDMKRAFEDRSSNDKPKPVSRAYDKLKEACLRFGADPCTFKNAVDVGASPGGWSQFLVQAGVGRVVAVDPGNLTIPHTRWETVVDDKEQATTPRGVVHIQGRVEDRIDDVASLGPFDAYVCDMNVQLPDTLACLKQLVPHLNPGAVVVVTIKHAPRSRHVMSVVHRARDGLRDLGLEGVQSAHLFANKHQEFTVMARVPTTVVQNGQ